MRFVTRKLWRAFPELDRFDDDRCGRFVAAANRQVGWRIFRWMSVFAAVVVGLASTAIVIAAETQAERLGWIQQTHVKDFLGGHPFFRTDLSLGVILIWHFAVAALLGALTRDLLLRLRVRSVLRNRGFCYRCHYPLLGLKVEADMQVACPECGHRTEVDPSLGELSGGAVGSDARFLPSAELIRRSDPARWKRAARKVAKWGAIACALVIAAAAVWFGLYELRIRRQAARALAMPSGVQQLNDLIRANSPGAQTEAAETLDKQLAALLQLFNDTEKAVWPQGRPTEVEGSSQLLPLDASYLIPRDVEAAATPLDGRGREQAQRMLGALEKNGFFDAAEKVLTAPRPEPTFSTPAPGPMFTLLLPEIAKITQLARWNQARCIAAAARNDPAGVEQSLRSCFAGARAVERTPLLISRITGAWLEQGALDRARAILTDHPDAAMVDAIDRALGGVSDPPPLWLSFEAERIGARDFVRYVFSDPGDVRFGCYNPQYRTLYGMGTGAGAPPPGTRLGTLEENLAAIDARWLPVIAAARAARPVRPALRFAGATGLGLIDVYSTAGVAPSVFDRVDQAALERTGTRIMIALERYRIARGSYPQSLGELAPAFLPVLPADPWTGGRFGYRRIDPADPDRRAYLLYSVGIDGVDDGGTPSEYPRDALIPGRATGYDYIINGSRR